MTNLQPLGDRAFLAHFETEAEARRWVAGVKGIGRIGIVDVVLAYRSAAVFADPDRLDLKRLEDELRALEPAPWADSEGKRIELPVLYDGEDLPEVARMLGLSETAVIAFHTVAEYDVFAIGFLPGFPYAGYLPQALSGLPRRRNPRTRVPAGSVAIAGKQTGIYPQGSPGGWHLIGRTPLRIVDLAEGYFPIRAGDRLRFVAVTPEEYLARRNERLDGPTLP